MSLRAFHIVFVTICTLLCAFFAVWAFRFASDRNEVITALGVIGVVGTIVMPIYGIYFYRKARKIFL